MTFDPALVAPAFESLRDGAFGVSIREQNGGILIERIDPVLGVSEVAVWLGIKPSTVRQMVAKRLLHPIKSNGVSGAMRFRKSRLIADLKILEG